MISKAEDRDYLLLSLITLVTIVVFLIIHSPSGHSNIKQIQRHQLSLSIALTPALPEISHLVSIITGKNPFKGFSGGSLTRLTIETEINTTVRICQSRQD